MHRVGYLELYTDPATRRYCMIKADLFYKNSMVRLTPVLLKTFASAKLTKCTGIELQAPNVHSHSFDTFFCTSARKLARWWSYPRKVHLDMHKPQRRVCHPAHCSYCNIHVLLQGCSGMCLPSWDLRNCAGRFCLCNRTGDEACHFHRTVFSSLEQCTGHHRRRREIERFSRVTRRQVPVH
jgi:hypothetical protein